MLNTMLYTFLLNPHNCNIGTTIDPILQMMELHKLSYIS